MPAGRRILIVGGYGAFGSCVAERLARSPVLDIVLAGRSLSRSQDAATALQSSAKATVSGIAIDATRPDLDALRQLAPTVLINASGPYQAQDYTLARAAITIGAHYIDLADARGFVTGIGALDVDARRAGVLVTSGASSVPALAAAIIDLYAFGFSRLDSIAHGIVPANGYDPGVATTASILGGVGRPFTMLIDGQWRTVFGWQGLERIGFPGLGTRWMAPCNVPDLELFPRRYPGVGTVRFSAGLEVALFQWSLSALSWAVRSGMVPKPERLAGRLMWLKRRLRMLGSDAGGMYVRLDGLDLDGQPLAVTVHLIARNNQGPYVPAIASVVLAAKLVRGELVTRGAMPCVGLFTLEEFRQEVADLDIEIAVTTAS